MMTTSMPPVMTKLATGQLLGFNGDLCTKGQWYEKTSHGMSLHEKSMAKHDKLQLDLLSLEWKKMHWRKLFLTHSGMNKSQVFTEESLIAFSSIKIAEIRSKLKCLPEWPIVNSGWSNGLVLSDTKPLPQAMLTLWGRAMHICVSKLTIIASDNGLSPGRRQAIICNNAGILSIGLLEINFSEILIEILTFSFKKMHLKVLSAKWRPFLSRP